jgi:hypothetical protein
LSAFTASLHVAPGGSRRYSILGKSSFLRHAAVLSENHIRTHDSLDDFIA